MMYDAWNRLSRIARYCPTPHNTQPFRIRPTSEVEADLVCVTSRLLPREDHGNLYCMAAFGMFVEALLRSGRHLGLDVDVTAEPGVDPATVHQGPGASVRLGRASIRGTCEAHDQPELLDTRRTSRLPYDGRPVSAQALADLRACACNAGHRFSSYDDDETVTWVLNTNVEAIIDNLQIAPERMEIQGWYRTGPTPEHGDGLWQLPMNQSKLEMGAAFFAPRFLKLPGVRHLARRRFLATQKGTRHVALLCGPFSTWDELLRAGRMLLEFWIIMARHRVYMHPYGSMLTNPVYAREVADRFGANDAWLILRMGYSPVPPRAPRLASIIVHE
ncbi:MAG TPA: hypothetical protein VEC56_08535 [Candidatus Krumholzibacteria bacterium]|nr:hypothetical protein [Candidatus Krumholzibacteria bacterium]